MQILLAHHLSFCGGVKRAVEILFRIAREKNQPVYVFGELIHNSQFNASLAAKNIFIAHTLEECRDKIVVIRTHGIPPELEARLKTTAKEVIDLTCPKVKRVQQLILDYANHHFQVIITGDPAHPEVIGLKGYAPAAVVISTLAECENLSPVLSAQTVLLSQTTFNEDKFQLIADCLRKRQPAMQVENTLCQATSERQEEIKTLSARATKTIVLGGKHSSNTLKLFEIAKKSSQGEVILIETPAELSLLSFHPDDVIALASGASTPDWIITQTLDYLENIQKGQQK